MSEYPGIDHRFIICDVCGKKFRLYETVQIRDRYNSLNNMIVCKADADKVNPGVYPIYLRETGIANKEYIRTEQSDVYTPNVNDDRLPGAPRNLFAVADAYTNSIRLYWDGPIDTGSGSIIGYSITQADPQLSTQFTLVANTHSESTEYYDTTSDMDLDYTYAVAAITDFGTGPYSALAYYPTKDPNILWEDINYLTVSQTGYVITTSTTLYPIRLNHVEGGLV